MRRNQICHATRLHLKYYIFANDYSPLFVLNIILKRESSEKSSVAPNSEEESVERKRAKSGIPTGIITTRPEGQAESNSTSIQITNLFGQPNPLTPTPSTSKQFHICILWKQLQFLIFIFRCQYSTAAKSFLSSKETFDWASPRYASMSIGFWPCASAGPID